MRTAWVSHHPFIWSSWRTRELGSYKESRGPAPARKERMRLRGFRALGERSGQLRGPPAQRGFGSPITLPLTFPRRHPPESRERAPQVPGWDRGVQDQRRAARGLGSRDRLTQLRAVSGSPGFGRRGPRPPASREAEEREGRNSGSQAAGRPGRPTRIPQQGARTHLARVSLHGTRTVPASSREFPPPPQRASSP